MIKYATMAPVPLRIRHTLTVSCLPRLDSQGVLPRTKDARTVSEHPHGHGRDVEAGLSENVLAERLVVKLARLETARHQVHDAAVNQQRHAQQQDDGEEEPAPVERIRYACFTACYGCQPLLQASLATAARSLEAHR